MPYDDEISDDESITFIKVPPPPPPPLGSLPHVVIDFDAHKNGISVSEPPTTITKPVTSNPKKEPDEKIQYGVVDPSPQDDEGYVQAVGMRPMKENTIWDVYNNEARVVDSELVKDWTSSLNSLLLFAAIFAAVLTAFIIESKKHLEQDPLDVMSSIMIFYTNNLANGTHKEFPQIPFQPPSWAISVNCIFFASLSASIIAAFASVVALQWVADYDAATTRGGSSPEDRFKRRQVRFSGVRTWKVGEIIAALPLLLYFSVFLFFIGLTQWMWHIHTAVAYIILSSGCAALVVYSASTLAAVVYPSAPFRTPLSKFIYALCHLPYSILYHISIRFGCFDSPSLASRRLSKANEKNRENHYVKSERNLISDGLIWLSTHISISSDSHRRLLLLLNQVKTLGLDQVSSEEFVEAPWGEMCNELGTHYFQFLQSSVITDQDMEGMKILLGCLENPRIGWHVTRQGPPPVNHGHNWGLFLQDPFLVPSGIINGTYLTLGKLPDMVSKERVPEERIRFRLAQWHYMYKDAFPRSLWHVNWIQILRMPGNDQDLQINLIKESFEALKNAQEEDVQKRIDELTGLISIMWTAFGKTSRIAELLNHPVVYRIHSKSWINQSCIRALRNCPDIHTIIKHLLLVREKDPNIQPLWTSLVSNQEISDVLSSLPPGQRGEAESLLNEEVEDLHIVEAFETFDNLMQIGCTVDQHLTMVKLILLSLEHDLPNGCGQYWTPERRLVLNKIQDPSLQLIACACSGSEWPFELSSALSPYLKGESWDLASAYCCGSSPSIDSTSIGRLRTELWDILSPVDSSRLLERALNDVNELAKLTSDFTQPSLGVEHGGDQLFFQLLKIEWVRFAPITIAAQYQTGGYTYPFHLVTALLWRRYSSLLPVPIQDSIPFSSACFVELFKLMGDVKRNQTRLIMILYQLYSKPLEYGDCDPMVDVVEELLASGTSGIAPVLRHTLAQALHIRRDNTNYMDLQDPEWKWKVTRVINKLVVPSPVCLRPPSKRLLICARAEVNCEAVGERFGMLGVREPIRNRKKENWFAGVKVTRIPDT